MADKSIDQLNAAETVYAADLFVLQQSGTAKKLTGQILENWLVSFADGHGGIQSIAKLGTSGLADTYRITLADTTTFDFVVTNGRSVNSIAKTSTSGLVDTYTIEYNDGTTGKFTVKNGEKGDKGDNFYIWIKYASVDPTVSPVVSIGDVPDDWMGVYSGYESEAPTDISKYRWYQIKGKKGDPGNKGEPGDTYTTLITYGVSDSPSVYPDTWYSSITSAPVVSGSYVWSRVQYTNSDNVVVNTSYNVSHIGANGTGAGTVTSITFGDTVYQDVAGNVTIPMPSSDEVGAIADPETKSGGQFLQWDASAGKWVAATPTGSVTTVNGVGVTAGTTNIKLTAKNIGPYFSHNLLDNSDFRNPVAQAGFNGTHGSALYPFDRWISWSANCTIGDGYMTPGSPIDQRFPKSQFDTGKAYTVAIGLNDGTIYVSSGVLSNGIGSYATAYFGIDGDIVFFRIGSGQNVVWAALYEGRYTAETLPEYQPKGYATELHECQRYFYLFDTSANGFYFPCIAGITQIPGFAFPVKMRAVPSMTIAVLKSWTTLGITDISSGISSKRCTVGGLQYIECTTAFPKAGLINLKADFVADI